MPPEQNKDAKKTLRHFYCRDTVWQTYERMSEELDRGVDELINEALRAFARGQGYSPDVAPPPVAEPATERGEVEEDTDNGGAPRAPAPRSSSRPLPPPPPAQGGGRRTQQIGSAASPLPPPPPPRRFPTPPPPPGRPTVSPPASAAAAEPGPAAGASPVLYLMFNSQKYKIDKEQFIIGRGSKSSDLPIKDGNISRKHAAIIRRNNTYYIKDLGSTNGIDFKGMRIDNKRIDEGDIFHLCDYELRFTYKR